jgi:hypothetical protein
MCELTGMPRRLVESWLERRVLIPAVRGSLGKGNGAKFGGRSLIGLAVVSAMWHSERGCSPAYAKKVLAYFARMSDLQIRTWINAESTHKERHGLPVAYPQSDITRPRLSAPDPITRAVVELPPLPGNDRIVEDVLHRLSKVEPIARHHLEDDSRTPAQKAGRRRAKKRAINKWK